MDAAGLGLAGKPDLRTPAVAGLDAHTPPAALDTTCTVHVAAIAPDELALSPA